ncbi:hypothetical protein X975_18833, partial [Stegodyphus mimosarum]
MAATILAKGRFGQNILSKALVQHSVRAQSTVPQTQENVPVKRKPYSPFQNTTGKFEYAMARVDDLLNWAR